jgi:GDP-D-mannose dehydratase
MVEHSNQRRNIVVWVFAVTTLPTTATEKRLLSRGHHYVVGIDEVGKDQNGKVRIQINPVYFRPTEVPFLLGDASKARNILGWEPKISLEYGLEKTYQWIYDELSSGSKKTWQ